MPVTLLSLLSRVTAGALILQTGVPAAQTVKADVEAGMAKRAASAALRAKALLPPPPMKGVPTMRVTPAVSPSTVAGPMRTGERKSGTILDEVGRSEIPITDTQRALWREELASGHPAPARAAWLRLWLAEADLAREYPQVAIGRIDALLRSNPLPEVRGLARHDRAMALFYSGRYGEARLAFEAELRGKDVGFDRREAALWVRHARGCEGYHLDNERLGVPIPLRLDPLCGASAVATCLRALGLPYDEARMARLVRHTGEGSNLQDLVDACDRLGVAAHPVQATEKGLRALPLPAVAHVEGDHFVAVVEADAKGVEYVCSDCGKWPGGPIRVSWKAWRAMKPGAFMTVTKRGSTAQQALDSVAPRSAKGASSAPSLDVSVGVTQHPVAPEVARLAARLVGNVATTFLAPFYQCAARPTSLHCPMGVGPCCPEDDSSSGAGNGGPKDGDPVNLATGEMEYRPAPDLTVYNPTGPSVTWRRYYNSFSRAYGAWGFGWDHAYSLGVSFYPGYVGPSNIWTGYVTFPNSGQVKFTVSSQPTASTPSVNALVAPGVPLKVEYKWNSSTNSRYFVVTFADRTKWITGTNRPNYFFPIVRLEDRVGNWIGFDYTTNASGPSRLSRIYDSSGATLLSVSVSNDAYQWTTSVTDRYGRSVSYTMANPGTYYTESLLLGQVSQVVPSGTSNPPVRYQYGYVAGGNGEANGFAYLGSISVPSPVGNGMSTATLQYDSGTGFITKTTDANGNTHNYSATDWNGSANANRTTVKVKNAAGTLVRQYTVGFDSLMNATVAKDATGQTVWTKTYGGGGAIYHPQATTDGNGRSWSNTYDSFGHVLTSTTPKGTTTTYTYDYSNFSLGELTSVQEGTKTPTSYTYYQPSGLPYTVESPIPGQAGSGGTQAQVFTYSAVGNLIAFSTPGNGSAATRTYTFDYTSDGAYTQAECLNRPIRIVDPLGKEVHLCYDDRGNLISLTDQSGAQGWSTYNLADQATSVVQPSTGTSGPGNAVQTSAYLYVGGPLVQIGEANESGTTVRTTSFTYGPEGEVLTRMGSTETAVMSYDALYRARTLADGKGSTTTYSYNAVGYPSKIAHSLSTGTTYDQTSFTSYDALGNLLSRTDGNGQVTNYTYADADGLLSSVSYPDSTASNVTLSYDAYDRTTGVNDATGTLSLTYDDANNLTVTTRRYTGVPAQTFVYAYWPDGSRRTMTNTVGTWTYAYDANGRYTSLVSPAGICSATYFDNGREATRTLPNGLKTSYGYLATGSLSSLQNTNGTGATTYSSYGSFAYDGVFNRTGMSSVVAGAPTQSGTTSFAYDLKNRLTLESSTRLGGVAQSHAYDAAGNPTTLRGAAQGFDSDNRQTSGGGAFVYDGNGSPTTYKGAALAFDPENRATTLGSGVSAGYRADGLRGWKSVAGAKTYYYYDEGNAVLETDGSGNVKATSVYAPDGLASTMRGGTWTHFLFDPQGNVAQRTNAFGTTLSNTVYDAYGASLTSGATPTDPYGYNARSGYYLDRETGLYLSQHRYYDPSTGRWITRDPIGVAGGVNLYAYCQSGPVANADPSGEGPGGEGGPWHLTDPSTGLKLPTACIKPTRFVKGDTCEMAKAKALALSLMIASHVAYDVQLGWPRHETEISSFMRALSKCNKVIAEVCTDGLDCRVPAPGMVPLPAPTPEPTPFWDTNFGRGLRDFGTGFLYGVGAGIVIGGLIVAPEIVGPILAGGGGGLVAVGA